MAELASQSTTMVIDAFTNGYQGIKLPVNLLLLPDCVLFIYDKKLEKEVSDFAGLSGALVFSEIVPYLTTHIVTTTETPELRQIIASIHTRTNEGATSHKAALTSEAVAIELVTPEWLKDCLCQQKQVSESNYRPPRSQVAERQAKKGSYIVKKNIFNN